MNRIGHKRAQRSIRNAKSLYQTDQVREFDRTVSLGSHPAFAREAKEGLSMNWGSDAFAQISAELEVGGDLSDDDSDEAAAIFAAAAAEAVTGGSADTVGGSGSGCGKYAGEPRSRSAEPASSSNGALNPYQRIPMSALTKQERRRLRTREREAAQEPGSITPRRKGWIYDPNITYKAVGRPVLPFLWSHGATLATAAGRPADSAAKIPKFGANRFRAKTPSTIKQVKPRKALKGVEALPDYSTTQNSFEVPHDWYDKTSLETPVQRVPMKSGGNAIQIPGHSGRSKKQARVAKKNNGEGSLNVTPENLSRIKTHLNNSTIEVQTDQ